MGPIWGRWSPCWTHELCYLGNFRTLYIFLRVNHYDDSGSPIVNYSYSCKLIQILFIFLSNRRTLNYFLVSTNPCLAQSVLDHPSIVLIWYIITSCHICTLHIHMDRIDIPCLWPPFGLPYSYTIYNLQLIADRWQSPKNKLFRNAYSSHVIYLWVVISEITFIGEENVAPCIQFWS